MVFEKKYKLSDLYVGHIGRIAKKSSINTGWNTFWKNHLEIDMVCICIPKYYEAQRISTGDKYPLYNDYMKQGTVFIKDIKPLDQFLGFDVATKVKSLSKKDIINYEKQLIEKFKEQTEIIK